MNENLNVQLPYRSREIARVGPTAGWMVLAVGPMWSIPSVAIGQYGLSWRFLVLVGREKKKVCEIGQINKISILKRFVWKNDDDHLPPYPKQMQPD